MPNKYLGFNFIPLVSYLIKGYKAICYGKIYGLSSAVHMYNVRVLMYTYSYLHRRFVQLRVGRFFVCPSACVKI